MSLLDRTAIALSGLCMLHCLALPLLLILLPVFEHLSAAHFHTQMLLFVLPVSTVALLAGYFRHRHPAALMAGAVGLSLLVLGATWAHQQSGVVVDRVLTLSGSLVLAIAHYGNSRLAKRHKAALLT